MVNKILLESRLSKDFELHNIDTGRGKLGEGKEGTLAFINFYYYSCQIIQLLWILAFKRPNILHQSVTWGKAFWKEVSFMLLARCLGIKVVAHIHGSKLDIQLKEAKLYKRWLMNIALKIPQVLVVLSEYWFKFLSETVSSKLNIVIVPNCVDQSIAEAMDRITFDAKKSECLVLYLGELCVRKGLLDALRAAILVCQQEPIARFVFAGAVEPGLQMKRIKRACQEAMMDGNIRFPGLVTGEEKLALFSEASVFILPSYNENLPIAILEAMSMGLPVVATPVAGIPELIEDGCNGFLIQPGDYHALADRILTLAREPELRQRMGKANVSNGRSKYHPQVFVSRIKEIYDRLLSST
ncbi:MAG TPA: glycosyltransferase family 4 protein [Patescibacteria group bacterium]|nr:glycosyltransferase family 4 protein [Patescibacteria group bacterium]